MDSTNVLSCAYIKISFSVTPLHYSLLSFGEPSTSQIILVAGEALFPSGRGEDDAKPGQSPLGASHYT